jgi:phosphatidylserine/phosphatidylglycerophosphate/cardiolipin synthase-like enzyme
MDLVRARSVLIVGPWLDEHVAQEIVAAAPREARFRALTRPYDAMDPGFVAQATAAHEALLASGRAEVRTLSTLHAKLVLVDEDVAFCGSANWYRYSLETSKEVVLRGPASEASGLLDLAEGLWQAGLPLAAIAPRPASGIAEPTHEPTRSTEGYRSEVLDPLAAQVLREVKGAFVLSGPGNRKR